MQHFCCIWWFASKSHHSPTVKENGSHKGLNNSRQESQDYFRILFTIFLHLNIFLINIIDLTFVFLLSLEIPAFQRKYLVRLHLNDVNITVFKSNFALKIPFILSFFVLSFLNHLGDSNIFVFSFTSQTDFLMYLFMYIAFQYYIIYFKFIFQTFYYFK